MKFFSLTLLVFTLLLAFVGPKPRIEFRVLPQFGYAPLSVHALLIIENGGEQFYCPELEWDWQDGSRSIETSDCDPYDGKPETAPVSYARDHVYGTGEYNVTLTLSHGAKKLRTLSQKVRVLERQ